MPGGQCVPGVSSLPDRRTEEFGLAAAGIDEKSRADEGNIKYDFYVPADDYDEIALIEKWVDAESLKKHGEQPHFKKMAGIKAQFNVETILEKYEA